MKLLRYKKTLVLLCSMLICSSINAQQGVVRKKTDAFFNKNWFISGAIGEQWLSNAAGNEYVAKAAVATWFNKYSGARVYFRAGYSPIDKSRQSSYIGGGVDYLFNFLALKDYNLQDRFLLNLTLGVGFDQFDLSKSDLSLKYTKAQAISGNLGLQVGYNFNSHIGIFIEPSFKVLPKYFNKNNKKDMIFRSDLMFGLIYNFNKHSYEKKVRNWDKEVTTLTAETQRLNNEINILKNDLMILKKSTEGKNIMTAPSKESVSLDIFFDQFSSFINKEQKKKIDDIGEWLENNDCKIKVIAFSDNQSNSELDSKMRNERIQAIKDILAEKYTIGEDRILVVSAEDIGYKNLTGCNVKVIFEPVKQ